MKKITILQNIKAEDTNIGVGAIVLLEHSTPPIINLLRERYLEDETCLCGDIDFLFKFDGVGLER